MNQESRLLIDKVERATRVNYHRAKTGASSAHHSLRLVFSEGATEADNISTMVDVVSDLEYALKNAAQLLDALCDYRNLKHDLATGRK